MRLPYSCPGKDVMVETRSPAGPAELRSDSPAELSAARTADPRAVIALTSAATFMAFLDATAVYVALPALHAGFPDSSISTLSWVVSGYGVAFAAFLTPAGRLADLVGRRALFLASVGLFGLASLSCALAPTLAVLILSRILQGGAAAGMIPSALAIVLAEVPSERRAATLGLWGAVGSLAGASGPSAGAVLIEATDWRAVFLLNIPIVAAVLIGGARLLPARRPTGRQLPDLIGSTAIALGLGLLVLGITKGSDWGWGTAATLAALGGGGACAMYAVSRSRRHPAPAIALDLWRDRTFRTASSASAFVSAGFFGWLLCVPLFLTTAWRYSILQAGFAMTPGALTSAVTATLVGRYVRPHWRGTTAVACMFVFCASNVALWAAAGTADHFFTLWLPTNALAGGAAGAAMTLMTTAAVTNARPSRFAAASGLNATARQVGAALGVAVAAAVLSAHQVAGLHALRNAFLGCAALGSLAAVIAWTLPDRPAVRHRGTPD